MPAWLTIQIDTDSQCFSAYFGTVESLCNPNAIAVPMTTGAVLDYECLAKDTFDERITPELSNQLSEGTAEPPETLESIARHSGIAAEEVGRSKAVTEVAVSQVTATSASRCVKPASVLACSAVSVLTRSSLLVVLAISTVDLTAV